MNSRDLENVTMHDKIAIFNTVYIVSSVNYFIYCNWWTMIKFVNDTWLYHQVTGSQIISQFLEQYTDYKYTDNSSERSVEMRMFRVNYYD